MASWFFLWHCGSVWACHYFYFRLLDLVEPLSLSIKVVVCIVLMQRPGSPPFSKKNARVCLPAVCMLQVLVWYSNNRYLVQLKEDIPEILVEYSNKAITICWNKLDRTPSCRRLFQRRHHSLAVAGEKDSVNQHQHEKWPMTTEVMQSVAGRMSTISWSAMAVTIISKRLVCIIVQLFSLILPRNKQQ